MNVIDSNVHLGESIYGASQSVAELRKSLRLNKVSRARISSFTPMNLDFDRANSFIRQVVRRDPGKFLGSVTVDPRMAKKAVDLLKRCLKFKEFSSISLNPFEQAFKVNSPAAFRIYEVAEKFESPVFLEAGYPIVSLPSQIAEAAKEFRKVNFVMTHCGQLLASGQSEADAFSALIERQNIYAETSQVILTGIGGFIEQLVSDGRNDIRSRIMFGSNAPFGDMTVELLRVEVAHITEENKEKILSKTAERLFGL